MSIDFSNYEHKPGATKTLVSDPNTGQPVEVDVEFGAAKFPELKPTYRPSAEEIAAAKKNPAAVVPPQPTSGVPGVPAPNDAKTPPSPNPNVPSGWPSPNPTPPPPVNPNNPTYR